MHVKFLLDFIRNVWYLWKIIHAYENQYECVNANEIFNISNSLII